jgi:hypothetical protein
MDREKIAGIILDNINYFVMLRDLDGQYQDVFNEVAFKSAEDILANN